MSALAFKTSPDNPGASGYQALMMHPSALATQLNDRFNIDSRLLASNNSPLNVIYVRCILIIHYYNACFSGISNNSSVLA